ncbi:AMP-dependent synthetase [Acidobacteria bacterium Mor1]|nr:AMP-dependent synthetase [Acidobacteria bacterium Mor1]
MIFKSPHADLEIPAGPLTPFVLQHAERLASEPALVDGPSGRTITYGELAGAIKALAGGLAARGFGKGDVLAIMAPNIPEYAVVFHGTAWMGGVITTVNPTYTADEVRHQLEDAGAKLLVTVSPFLEVARKAAEGTAVEEVFTIDPGDAPQLTELFGAPMAEHAAVAPDDVVALPYSSGTTGLSKGVMLSHRNLIANLLQVGDVLPIAEGENVVSFLPFFHIYGMQVLMNGALWQGGKALTMPRFDLELFLRLTQDHRSPRAFVVPPVVLALAKHPLVDKFDLSALEVMISGAAPLGGGLAGEVSERLDCEVLQGFGMTELSPVTHFSLKGQVKLGTIGFLLANTEARIVDPCSGESLGNEADGEIWIRGPQVMLGYLNNPEATAETIVEDGWLRTGDVARVDDDGHFRIVDRLKELIKYKAFQVPPAELEALLVTHPAVADAAVIGICDAECGELPKGFVVLKPDAQASAEDIMAFVAERVAHYKQLRLLEFVDEIPKAASGKILRRVLRERG